MMLSIWPNKTPLWDNSLENHSIVNWIKDWEVTSEKKKIFQYKNLKVLETKSYRTQELLYENTLPTLPRGEAPQSIQVKAKLNKDFPDFSLPPNTWPCKFISYAS